MITSETEYRQILEKIDILMKKGEENLIDSDLDMLQKMVNAVSAYENKTIVLPFPKTLSEMVELKLFEQKMTQTEFARRSGLGVAKVNQIIKGKRNVDVPFLKAVHSVLGVPADFLLSVV